MIIVSLSLLNVDMRLRVNNETGDTEEEKINDIQLTKLMLDIPVPFVSAQSWVVYDCNSEQILFGRMERERREMASLTKIMTCYVVLNLIKRFNLEERKHLVEVSEIAS